MLAAYLFTRTEEWSRATVRLLAPARPEEIEQVRADLGDMLDKARIRAQIVCLIDPDQAAIVAACADASLVLLTLRIHRDVTLDPVGGDLDALLQRLPMTAVVLAGETVDLLAGPESDYASLGAAEEAFAEAEARLETLESHLAGIDGDIESLRFWAIPDDASVEEQVAELERRRQIVLRRVLKARVKVESARADVDSLLNDRP